MFHNMVFHQYIQQFSFVSTVILFFHTILIVSLFRLLFILLVHLFCYIIFLFYFHLHNILKLVPILISVVIFSCQPFLYWTQIHPILLLIYSFIYLYYISIFYHYMWIFIHILIIFLHFIFCIPNSHCTLNRILLIMKYFQ